jgi:WD40 repeat protein
MKSVNAPTRVVTASADHTARLWDAHTGEQVGLFKGHDDQVYDAEFSPDGANIVTASVDKTARIWIAPRTVYELIENAKRQVPRCLEEKQREEYLLKREIPNWCYAMSKVYR